MTRPTAVLLDVGGVFLLPEHHRIAGAIERGGSSVDRDRIDGAHYAGAARFTTDLDVERDWSASWFRYLEAYVDWCGIPPPSREEVHRHLDSEFADAALWLQEVPGCREGLAALSAAGLRLGIVSNADGMIGARLGELGILQVGPGGGVPVECVIDSGAVGVMKPDPRIFTIALEAMDLVPDDVWYVGDMPAIDVVGATRAGLHPIVMDPFDLHHGAGYARVSSLAELAELARG